MKDGKEGSTAKKRTVNKPAVERPGRKSQLATRLSQVTMSSNLQMLESLSEEEEEEEEGDEELMTLLGGRSSCLLGLESGDAATPTSFHQALAE